MIVLDTDVMRDLLREYPPAVTWLESIGEEEVVLPGFVVMELIQGCRNKGEGYEDGYDDITTLREISIRPNPSHECYNGKYESSDNAASETAVLIFSTDRLRDGMHPKEVLME